MARLNFKIELGPGNALGPGKVTLLERIGEHGSIAAAARSMNMSYRRAWLLIDSLNRCFGSPVLAASTGGRSGGGAVLTPFGHEVVARYRAIEAEAEAAAAVHLDALQAACAPAS